MRFRFWVGCMQLFQAGGVVVIITGAGFHPLGANRHTVLGSDFREAHGSHRRALEVVDSLQHPR